MLAIKVENSEVALRAFKRCAMLGIVRNKWKVIVVLLRIAVVEEVRFNARVIDKSH